MGALALLSGATIIPTTHRRCLVNHLAAPLDPTILGLSLARPIITAIIIAVLPVSLARITIIHPAHLDPILVEADSLLTLQVPETLLDPTPTTALLAKTTPPPTLILHLLEDLDRT